MDTGRTAYVIVFEAAFVVCPDKKYVPCMFRSIIHIIITHITITRTDITHTEYVDICECILLAACICC